MHSPVKTFLTAAALALVAAGSVVISPAGAQERYPDDRYPPYRDRQDRYAQERSAGGEAQVDIATFHDALDAYGRWFAHPQYGYVWSPEVDRNWRPYTRGKWQFTEEHGWYWEAEEPWGWAVFHYGRWFLDDDSGWVWVPGTEWAPAWVAWRNSDENIGWAPLPPEAEWRNDGLHFSQTYYDSPRFNAAWIFAPIAVLGGYAAYRYIYPASRNYAYVSSTRWAPSHRFVNSRIYNAGFDRNRYQQVTGRQITPLRIVSTNAPHRPGWTGAPRGTVQVYRPRVAPSAVTLAPPKLAEPPRRDWQHGRPGIQQQPFQRPAGTVSAPQGQPPVQPQAQPGGFVRPGQRPPITPPKPAPQPQAQVPVQQPPTPAPQPQAQVPVQQPPQTGRSGRNPLINPTPQVINPQAAPQQAPSTGRANGVRPQPSAAPQSGPAQGQRGNAGQPGAQQGQRGQGGQGGGQPADPRRKPPADPNQPAPR